MVNNVINGTGGTNGTNGINDTDGHANGPDLGRPIFVVTVPRSCSTAFERAFLTRKDLHCEHEPFGDAFYYGPERLSTRYQKVQERENSGFDKVTYKDILDRLEAGHGKDGKRLFLKDMAYYIVPPNGMKQTLALSLHLKESIHDLDNPSVIPYNCLTKYDYVFLIRNPFKSVPSYVRCCTGELGKMTGFEYFDPQEVGFRELRLLFDYLKNKGALGESDPFVIDADDLLDHPEEVVRRVCEHTGLRFDKSMLKWDARDGIEAFEKWKGFHEDALQSTGLKPREKGPKQKTEEEEYAGWVEKYGKELADVILKTAKDNLEDYEYLKQFKIKV